MKKISQNKIRGWVISLSVIFLLVGFFVFQTNKFSEGATETDQVNFSVTVAQIITLNCGTDVNLEYQAPQ